MFTAFPETTNATPFTWTASSLFTSAPGAMPSSFVKCSLDIKPCLLAFASG